MYKLVLFDLDGTLLRRDKTVSDYTLSVLQRCREKGILLGIATARSAVNAAQFTAVISPEVVISSGGAYAEINGKCVYYRGFTPEETRAVISEAKAHGCQITVDSKDGHYATYVKKNDLSWSGTILTDLEDFDMSSQKICVEVKNDDAAVQSILEAVPDCRCVKFTRSNWYMLTKSSATKEAAAEEVAKAIGIELSEAIAFGDDISDIGLMKACGLGIATANAFKKAKKAAVDLCGDCDADGVAVWIEKNLL